MTLLSQWSPHNIVGGLRPTTRSSAPFPATDDDSLVLMLLVNNLFLDDTVLLDRGLQGD
jgi:hypothetical protein